MLSFPSLPAVHSRRISSHPPTTAQTPQSYTKPEIKPTQPAARYACRGGECKTQEKSEKKKKATFMCADASQSPRQHETPTQMR
ncbi:hypothetical protein TRSC58_07223 [Trypanosoma rangeli SC58]|uniref:Uncharacterized protein n=1 Tax=Trypanosoma rangeli SC58 TaxID=429131 RepID=A0A061IVX2_TRYRA|nr:hypothetical protein TRSC58_07223 [Trypanosoma rangeli SC58]